MDTATLTRAAALREDGFTIIEVLVAVLVLSVGIVSLVGSFDPARKLGTKAEIHQVASARAEAELNRISSLKWKSIALKEAPTKGESSTEPSYYYSTGPCNSSGPESPQKPVTSGTGTKAPRSRRSTSNRPLKIPSKTTRNRGPPR